MAVNQNMPTGAHPFGALLRITDCYASGTVYPGDFVKNESGGGVVVVAAGDAIRGVAMHYATSGQQVKVADHPDQEFIIQCSSTNMAAQTNINSNANIVATAASSTYKMSRQALDDSTLATTSSLQLKVLRLATDVDAKVAGLNAFGSYPNVIVRINNDQLQSAGIAGV